MSTVTPRYEGAQDATSRASSKRVLEMLRARVRSREKCTHSWCAYDDACSAHVCTLHLNNAPDSNVFKFCSEVPGLGVRTANRILAEREHAPFASSFDFDRRVPRLSFERLKILVERCGFAVSLDRDPAQEVLADDRCTDITPASDAGSTLLDFDHMESVEDTVVQIATWNAGRMGMNGKYLDAKIEHLVRFVADAKHIAVLALQEVYLDVPQHVANCLQTALGTPWRALTVEVDCAEADETREYLMQAFVYNNSIIATADEFTKIIPEHLLSPFRRVPVGAIFHLSSPQKPEGKRTALAVLNVHLSTRNTENEIEQLHPLLSFVKGHTREQCAENVLNMCIGDFNANSDTPVFTSVREAGFTELVAPPNFPDPSDAPRYLGTPTTVGNNWYDNVWIDNEHRPCVENAWCFDFGGRCPALADSSGYHYAGYRRSLRSDHFALVVQVRV